MKRYAYTVWTWTAGSAVWNLALATDDYAKAAQLVRALKYDGFSSSSQAVRMFGAYAFTLPYRLELVSGGRTYVYGELPGATEAFIVGHALRALIPSSYTRTRNAVTGQAVRLADVMNPAGYV